MYSLSGPQPFYSRPGMVPRAFHDPMAFSGSPTVRGEPAKSLGGSGSHTLLESQKALPVSQEGLVLSFVPRAFIWDLGLLG